MKRVVLEDVAEVFVVRCLHKSKKVPVLSAVMMRFGHPQTVNFDIFAAKLCPDPSPSFV